MWMGASFFIIPPLVFCAEGFVCLVIMLAPSTITFASSTSTSFTRRGFLISLSSPEIIITWSPFLILYFGLNLVFILLTLYLFPDTARNFYLINLCISIWLHLRRT